MCVKESARACILQKTHVIKYAVPHVASYCVCVCLYTGTCRQPCGKLPPPSERQTRTERERKREHARKSEGAKRYSERNALVRESARASEGERE